MGLSAILGRKSKSKIFICYRRSGEGAGFGGRIADKLVKHFGHAQCFRDIENIEKGTDFVESIKYATSICELLLVVIGPDWITLKDEQGNVKIQDKNDFVRLEVGTALARGIRVIPVLVGGAKVPSEEQLPEDLKPLVRRQSHELTDQRWDYDSDQLLKSIESIGIRGMSPEEHEARKRKQKIVATALLTSFLILSAVGMWLYLKPPSPSPDPNPKPDYVTPVIQATEAQEEISDLKDNSTKPIKVSETKKNSYDREKGSIKNVITLSSSLEAEALMTQDLATLGQVFTGDALRNYKAILSQLRIRGIYLFNILESQSFGEIKVYTEGNRLLAEAEVFETWSGHTHRASDQLCLEHTESNDAPQTVFLEKKKDSWYITSISFHTTPPPIINPCGQYNCYLLTQS